MWLETWDSLHTPKTRRLAYCVLLILRREFVEMLNYWVVSHPVDHTSLPLILQVNLIGQRFVFKGIKHDNFSTTLLPSIIITQRVLYMPNFYLKITRVPCSKNLQIYPILTSKLVIKISQPTLSEMHSRQPFYSLGKLVRGSQNDNNTTTVPRFHPPCI